MDVNKLKNVKGAILATDGFEESELLEPKRLLEQEGIILHVVSNKENIISWYKRNWHKTIRVDKQIDDIVVEEYDLLLLPGGVINPDRLRRDFRAVDLVKKFDDRNKIIAAICHGPQLLIDADVVKGKTITSFRSIKKDLINAGASWIDHEVVEDQNIITSREPDDIPVFAKTIINKLTK